MKIKSKRKSSVVLILGMIFVISTISNYNIIADQGKNRGPVEIRYDNNLQRLKKSGFWTTNFIHIDGNWSYTVGNFSWCSGDGSWSNPYIIENVTIDASTSPTGSGIFIINSKNDYFIIRNVTVYNAGSAAYDGGIKLVNTNNGSLINNNCSNNGDQGIIIYNNCANNTISGNIANNNINIGLCITGNCVNNIISGNTANYAIIGMWIKDNCDNNVISGNRANENENNGISFESGCDNNIISGNTANNNKALTTGWGISFQVSCNNNLISGNIASNNGTTNQMIGILLLSCDNNTVSGNTVNNNNVAGIYVSDDCDNNTILENIVFENGNGIYLTSNTFNNLIFQNCIFNNSINGFDLESNNWDNGVIGNYWSDYTGIDADHDGIGDTPYNVAGGAGNKDNKPIMNYDPFFFKPPNDLTYEVGTIEHNIKWTVITTLLFPVTYNIFKDGTSVKTGKIFNYVNEIALNVDDLETGIHGFTIEVADGTGGTFSDGVWVTVINSAPSFTAIPTDFSYEVGDLGNNLSWTFSDVSTNNPTYTITRNGVLLIIDNPCISGQAIEFSVDGLNTGLYGFTIEINDGYGGTVLDSVWVTVNLFNRLFIETIDQSFTKEEFNIKFSVYNGSGQGIDFAIMQLWWNGEEVPPADISNLGGGLYTISLTPITILPGEDPILLNMTISALGYKDKYFETFIAVDPDTLKSEDFFPPITPFEVILINILLIAGIPAALILVIVYYFKRRKITQ